MADLMECFIFTIVWCLRYCDDTQFMHRSNRFKVLVSLVHLTY